MIIIKANTKRKTTAPKALSINTKPTTLKNNKAVIPVAISSDLSNFIPLPPR